MTTHEIIQEKLRVRRAEEQARSQQRACYLSVPVGAKVLPGDIGRWPDGTEIEIPRHFYGQKITREGFIFRRAAQEDNDAGQRHSPRHELPLPTDSV